MYEIEITPEGLRHLNRFPDKVRQSALKSIFEHPDYVTTLDEYGACMAQLCYQTSDPSMTLNLTWSISFGDESAEALAEHANTRLRWLPETGHVKGVRRCRCSYSSNMTSLPK